MKSGVVKDVEAGWITYDNNIKGKYNCKERFYFNPLPHSRKMPPTPHRPHKFVYKVESLV